MRLFYEGRRLKQTMCTLLPIGILLPPAGEHIEHTMVTDGVHNHYIACLDMTVIPYISPGKNETLVHE